jgi:hypothetical protein
MVGAGLKNKLRTFSLNSISFLSFNFKIIIKRSQKSVNQGLLLNLRAMYQRAAA